MKQVTKLSMIAIMSLIMIGCASTGDLDELHAHVDSDMKVLQGQVDTITVEQAKLAAEQAGVNTKLDNMFKKTMSK